MNTMFKFELNSTEKQDTFETKAEMITDKFKSWAVKNPTCFENLQTKDSIKDFITNSKVLRFDITAEQVFDELEKQGIISEHVEEEIIYSIKPEDETVSFRPHRYTLITDEDVYKQIEENKKFIKDIFDEDIVDIVHEMALSLEQEKPVEDKDYYNAFAEAGLIRGGSKQVDQDFDLLVKLERRFKERDKIEHTEKNKKIATIIERALAYAVSKLHWYGNNISVQYTSRFDDFVGGFDGVLQFKKDAEKDNFLGLGIDVTYTGIHSPVYKQKLFDLLDDIKTNNLNIKYFTNDQGEMMQEFSVPKIILNFTVKDVREIAKFVKGNDNAEVVEKFKHSSQKLTVLKQVLIACELLADFSYEYHAGISNEYREVISSIKKLAQDNEELQSVLANHQKDEMTLTMKGLIAEYRAPRAKRA